ncbi:MAG: IclR family transcriptional regulator [Candidatus Adiutrix sp.]|jgi:DNA-binding IclR family transcriptional regulator|nr:IclR family transcriptional regulator [Candidatus Adiutrix sp.]
MAAEKAYTVNSLNKAMDLIESLCEHGPSSLADLRGRLGLDKATMYRLLNTLRLRGYVDQSLVDHRYFITRKLFLLACQEIDRVGLPDLARPYLEKLAAAFREDAQMSLLTGPGQAVCIDKVEAAPSQAVRLNMTLGSEVLVYASGMGKALLAFSPPAVQDEVLSRLVMERLSSRTLRNAAALRKELQRIRRQGYAVDDGETIESVFCIGVPILNHRGEAAAAVSVNGPRARMLDKKEAVINMLLDCSRELSLLYGYPPEQWPVGRPGK